jgi:hypothetical protein
MTRFWTALTIMLALCVSAAACAQDELPKDAPPPKHAAPKTSPQPTPPMADAAPAGTMIDEATATLLALDKVTAQVKKLSAKVGQTVPFGTLTIQVDACRKSSPEDSPESAAFLKITDAKPGEAPQVVFSGWMFASSPALSAMDHPVYDISVVACGDDAASPAPAQ